MLQCCNEARTGLDGSKIDECHLDGYRLTAKCSTNAHSLDEGIVDTALMHTALLHVALMEVSMDTASEMHAYTKASGMQQW